MKFKAGDIVRGVVGYSSSPWIIDGHLFRVKKVTKYVFIGTLPGDGWDEHHFELVDPKDVTEIERIIYNL